MTVKLLTEHHLEFLSLKGGCTGLSESTLDTLLEITCRDSYNSMATFCCFCRLLIFFKINFFEIFLQEYHQSGKQTGIQTGPYCLQMSSADSTSRQRVKATLKKETSSRLKCIVTLFCYYNFAVTLAGNIQTMKPVEIHRIPILYDSHAHRIGGNRKR